MAKKSKINMNELSLKVKLAQGKEGYRSALEELRAINELCTTNGIPEREQVFESEPEIKASIQTLERVKRLILKLRKK